MKRKLGIGSLSLVLVIIAIFWCCNISILNNFCLGDYILNMFDIPIWSNGTTGIHYTIFYSYIFLIPAIFLGIKYKEDLFATAGKTISIILGIIILLGSLFMVGRPKENNNANVFEQQEAYINEKNKEDVPNQNKVTTIDIEKSFLIDGEERQSYTLNQEEIYVVMNIIQDLYFTDETCDGIPDYAIKINTQDTESLNMFSVEIYDKEVHLLKDSEEAVLTEEQSSELKTIIEKYFNK